MSAPYFDALRAVCQPIRAGDYPHTLQPMRALLQAIGNPQARFPAVVVGGSVGKGTTCHYTARLLRAAGLKVGLFTSPHLHSFRERFVIDGERISPDEFVTAADILQQALPLARANGRLYSTFENATALAVWWFAQKQVDVAVLEIGLGGRYDAVNTVPNALSVITPIEAEHIAMLGGTLRSIAWHKAGIIREDGYAVTGRQHAEVAAILQHEAALKGAKLRTVDIADDASPQEAAACLALAAYHNLVDRKIITRRSFNLSAYFRGLPGRMEEVRLGDRRLLIDGGHTPSSATSLREAINGLVRPSEQVRVVVGMLQDKSAREFLTAFDDAHIHLVLTCAPGHRAYAPEALRAQFQPRYASVEIIPELNDALAQVQTAPEALFVVAGSLRMAAAAREAYGLLSADELAEAQATRAIFEGGDYLAKLS